MAIINRVLVIIKSFLGGGLCPLRSPLPVEAVGRKGGAVAFTPRPNLKTKGRAVAADFPGGMAHAGKKLERTGRWKIVSHLFRPRSMI